MRRVVDLRLITELSRVFTTIVGAAGVSSLTSRRCLGTVGDAER